MVGPVRPEFVLFGSSIVQDSFSNEGWGAILATLYARKVFLFFLCAFKGVRNNCMLLSKLCGYSNVIIVLHCTLDLTFTVYCHLHLSSEILL